MTTTKTSTTLAAGEVVAERDEDAGHEQGSEGGDREPDRPGRVIGTGVASCHASGIRRSAA